MQVLWREVYEDDRSLTVDEFLFCYKPLEINQPLGFYQFTSRDKDCRLIKSLVMSDKPRVVKPSLPTSKMSIPIFDVDSSIPIEVTSAKTIPPSFQPSQRVPMNLLENETWLGKV